MQIELPDGSYESISLLDPAEARVNLGIAFSPSGSDEMHLRGSGDAQEINGSPYRHARNCG